ncbi:MAG: AAA family ATPase, partial [Oceanobacter sp.]
NPIEQEGTYPLPEAQLDRFTMHVKIDYPDAKAELQILKLARGEAMNQGEDVSNPISQADIFAARQQALALHMSDAVEQYIVQLVMATRQPEHYGEELASLIEYGASPRGTIALERCARANAWLEGRDYVSPDDVQAVAHDVLRHRILLSFEAEASGETPDSVIDSLLVRVPVL